MARFCSSCGAPLEDGVKFCGKCGAAQAVVQQSPTPSPQQNYNAQPSYNPPPTNNPPLRRDFEIDFAALKDKFLSLDGRIDRVTYFKRTTMVNGVLLWLIGALVWLTAVLSTLFKSLEDPLIKIFGILFFVVLVASLIPKFCLDVRRIKDYSHLPASGEKKIWTYAILSVLCSFSASVFLFQWWFLDGEVTHKKFLSSCIVAAIWWGYLQFQQGVVGTNSFGEDPLR